MTPNCSVNQSPHEAHSLGGLSQLELTEIALYTVQKINNYPKSFGKTVDNYFHLLFPDEIKAYLAMRTINEQSAIQLGC